MKNTDKRMSALDRKLTASTKRLADLYIHDTRNYRGELLQWIQQLNYEVWEAFYRFQKGDVTPIRISSGLMRVVGNGMIIYLIKVIREDKQVVYRIEKGLFLVCDDEFYDYKQALKNFNSYI